LPDFSRYDQTEKYTKWQQYLCIRLPNCYMYVEHTGWAHSIYCTNINNSKVLQTYPNWNFEFEKIYHLANLTDLTITNYNASTVNTYSTRNRTFRKQKYFTYKTLFEHSSLRQLQCCSIKCVGRRIGSSYETRKPCV
jgi:hypothetical protein